MFLVRRRPTLNKEKGIDNQPSLALHCVRKDGRREITKLSHHTLSEARDLAKWVLNVGNGHYREVDISTEDGIVEMIQNAGAPTNHSEVLLVEDNAGDAILVGQALADCPTRVHLRIARDGEQALQILGEPDFIPALIILDLNIPKLSGYTVLSMYRPEKTPVVVFTASENQADVGRVFSLGAREFIHKPMDLGEYKTAVCGIVQRWVPHDDGDPAIS